MLTHRNLVYAAYTYADAVGDRRQAVRGRQLSAAVPRRRALLWRGDASGARAARVSFAESIDTVAINIREIAPTFFVGVPRI